MSNKYKTVKTKNPWAAITAEVVAYAVKEMRKPVAPSSLMKARRRRAAVLWLGSTRAVVYCDFMDIEITRILRRIDWQHYAEQELAAGGLDDAERTLLEQGVAHFKAIERRTAWQTQESSTQ